MGNISSKKTARAHSAPPDPPVVPAVEVTPPPETVHEYILTEIKKHGKRVAQVDAETGEEVTFDSILDRTAALAAGLRARGLQHGDVALIIGENSPHYPWVLLGVMQTGATAHLVNHKSSTREVEHAISISRPKMALISSVVSESADITAVLGGSTCIFHILVWGCESADIQLPDGVASLERLVLSPARSASSCLMSPGSPSSQSTVVEVASPGAGPAAEAEQSGRQSPCVMVGEREAAASCCSSGTTAPPPTPTSPAVAVSCSSEGRTHFHNILERPVEGVPSPGTTTATRDSVALLLSSSGSTGLPKAVMLTHHNILAAFEQERVFIAPDDVMLGLSPYSHAFGGILMLMALSVGVRVVAVGRFSLERLVDAVERYSVTVLHVVPSLLVALSKHPNVVALSLRMTSVRRIWTGAAQVSPLVQTEIKGRLPRVKLYHSYGMTETTFTTMHGEARADKPGSPGTLAAGMHCKIVDPSTGATLTGRSVRGELCFKGPMIMKGYLGNPEATSEAVDPEGWLHSGDLGFHDEDGYYYVVDRMKDILKFNGYQVSPTELEALLTTHPEVKDAAVVGVPHDYGDAPYALIVLAEGAMVTAEDIQRYIAERVAPHKQLRGGVSFVDSFPKTASGKLQRKKLQSLYMESHINSSSASSSCSSVGAQAESQSQSQSQPQPQRQERVQVPEAKVDTPPPVSAHTSPVSPESMGSSEIFLSPRLATPGGSEGSHANDSPMVICLTPATPPEIEVPPQAQLDTPTSPQE